MRIFGAMIAVLMLGGIASADCNTKDEGGPVLTIELWGNEPIPQDYVDASTRPETTDTCNKMIATMSHPERQPAIMRARCIAKIR